MGGGGPSQAQSTTNSGPPAWLQPYAKDFMQGVFGQVFPGGTPQNPGSLASMPQGLNQQVAPFSPAQLQAMQMGILNTPGAQSLANTGAGTQGLYASGGMLGPNPFLNSYFNQAAGQDVMNYRLATQPALAAQFQQAGAFNSPGFNQAQGLAQYGLGQSLATLGANIYEPAYQFESGQALNAAQNAGQGISQLYQPMQALFGIGSAQQQQGQNILNTNYGNAVQAANWPFALLSQLGGALGQGAMGGGRVVSQGPMPGGK